SDLFARRSRHHLPLLAARLVVVLDRDRALRLEALDVIARILQLVDAGKALGMRAIHDVTCREDARRQNLTRALILRRREYLGRIVRRIVNGRDAEREMRER